MPCWPIACTGRVLGGWTGARKSLGSADVARTYGLPFDVLTVNGMVVDGTRASCFSADVGISAVLQLEDAVWKIPIVLDGQHTGKRPARVLRRGE